MFTLIEERNIESRRMRGLLFRHTCGLEVLSLERDDPENVFAVAFRTTPEDSTGVAHIIEHSLLCGSKRYPVKEPFTEMLKGSLATYINAFTTQEYTAYPIASVVPKDYFNLASVYLDAVFSPLMTRAAFMQEGWHLAFSRPGDVNSPLRRNGIVLNEMKGDMNDIDTLIQHEVNQALYARTPRRFNSGGYPPEIPSLTYGKYRSFYRRHYHPSQAKVFLYGGIPTEEKLAFLEKELEAIGPLPPPPGSLPPHPLRTPWKNRHVKTASYVPELSQGEGRGAWARAYYIGGEYDPMLDSAFGFLEAILQGTQASPLTRIVMESGLAESFCISGYDDETLETSYLVALNGVRFRDFGRVEALVDGIFRDCAEKGFEPEAVESTFTQFKRQHASANDSSVMPILEDVFDAWCYGLSPFLFLDKRAHLLELERRLSEDPRWLQDIVRRYFCDNRQVITLRLIPDKGLEKAQAKAERDELSALKKSLTRRQRERIDRAAQRLLAAQAAQNPPEALATLPRLGRGDFPAISPCVKTQTTMLKSGARFLDVAMPGNGISYLSMALPFSGISAEMSAYSSLFNAFFASVGTRELTWRQFTDKWAFLGASCRCDVSLSNHTATAAHEPRSFLVVTLSTLDERFGEMLDLFMQKWHDSIYTERERMQIVMRRLWSKARSLVIENAGSLAVNRALAGLTPLTSLKEFQSGIPNLQRTGRLAAAFRRSFDEFSAILTRFGSELAKTPPAEFSYLGPEANRELAIRFAEAFPPLTNPPDWSVRIPADAAVLGTGRREGLCIPAQVSACARAMEAPHTWEDGFAELTVVSNLLANGFLWDEIRVKNGAYGVNCQYRGGSGILCLSSSQDPAAENSFRLFDSLGKFPFAYTDKELLDGVMCALKGLLAPTRPKQATSVSVVDAVLERGDAFYQRIADECLSLTPERLKRTASEFFASAHRGNDCIIGPQKAIESLEMDTSLEI